MTVKTPSALDTETTTNITQNTTKSNSGTNAQALFLNIIDSMFGATITAIDNTDSPYTLVYDDQTVLVCDTSGGAITVNLPAVASNTGKSIWILCTSASNDVTVDPNSSEQINGTTTLTISGAYAWAKVVNDGTTHYAFT